MFFSIFGRLWLMFAFSYIFVVNSTMEKLKILFVVFSLFLFVLPLASFAQPKRPTNVKNTPVLNADLLITGGTVVTMDKDRRLIEDGAVAVKNGEIILVGKRTEVTKNLRAKQTIDAKGKLIIP